MINPTAAVIVTVCTTCRQTDTPRDAAEGARLFEALRAAAEGDTHVIVRPTQCLSVCKRVCTVALSGEGLYTYLFGDLDAASDAPAVLQMAHACSEAEHGFVPWKARPEALRKGTIARLPPAGWSPEDGSAPQ